MTKNPVLNALSAALYVAVVACVMFFGGQAAEGPDTVLIPIALLSLFSLSAAVMAAIFFYQPIRMYLDGEREQATKLIFQTIGVFGLITALLLVVLFSGVFV